MDPVKIGEQVENLSNGRKWKIAPCSRCHNDFGFFEGTVADLEGDDRVCVGCLLFADTPFDGAITGV